MVLTSLSLSHFRSYEKSSYTFSPHTTIILGPNASGKTNLLEAIFLSAIGKSFRTDDHRDMISAKEEIARVAMEAQTKSDSLKLDVMLTRGDIGRMKAPLRKYMVNGVAKRLVDFVGHFRATLFWPEDLELIIGSPSRRRKYMDFILLQVDREYRRSLLSYEKGLRQRNKLLELIREGKAHHHQLLFWDQLLIKDGNYIERKREELIEFLNTSDTRGYDLGHFNVTYDKSAISEERLHQYSQEEIASGTTLVGPHRDDFLLDMVDDGQTRNLHHFGSRGEQRVGILWLKLGELHFIKQHIEESPVLILDDIFSELDHAHREVIFQFIHQQQTIITTADEHFIGKEHLKDGTIIRLD